MSTWPSPSLRHLARLTDGDGVVEHARGAVPRPELGCCVDDAGRLLALACRLPGDPHARRLATVALAFLERAHVGPGRFRLRLLPGGRWSHHPPSDDGTARALLGLATAAHRSPWADVRGRAADLLAASLPFSSPHPRALATAAVAAAEVPELAAAHDLVDEALTYLPRLRSQGSWRWPVHRLTYANALLPEGLLAAGEVARDGGAVDAGYTMLAWLVREEEAAGHFSFTPVGGRGEGDARPGYDQQPIEAWAMAEACNRAHRLSGEGTWLHHLALAAAWFLGDNDLGLPVYDPVTGGGYDGLSRTHVNRNQGAESSMAFVGTMASALEHARPAEGARTCRSPSCSPATPSTP